MPFCGRLTRQAVFERSHASFHSLKWKSSGWLRSKVRNVKRKQIPQSEENMLTKEHLQKRQTAFTNLSSNADISSLTYRLFPSSTHDRKGANTPSQVSRIDPSNAACFQSKLGTSCTTIHQQTSVTRREAPPTGHPVSRLFRFVLEKCITHHPPQFSF